MSFSKSFSASRVALLDIGGEELGTPTEPEVDDGGDTLLSQANNDIAQIDNTLNTVEDGTNDVNELNGIADNLEDAEADGGATPAMIEMAEVAVEHRIMSLTKSRILPAKRLLPAQEAFVGMKGRKKATQIAKEGIREWASQARANISAQLDKAITFFRGLGPKISEGLEKAKAELARIKDGIKSGEITFGGTVRAIPGAVWNGLCIAGKFGKEVFNTGIDKASAFISRMTEWLKSFRSGVKATNAEEVAQDVTSDTPATESEDMSGESGDSAPAEAKVGIGGKLKAKLTSSWSAVMAFIKSFGSKKKDAGEGLVAVTANDVLPGDQVVTITGPVAASNNLDAALAGMKVEITGGGEGGGGEEVPTFKSAGEATGIIDKLMGLIDKVKAMVAGTTEAASVAQTASSDIAKVTQEEGSASGGEEGGEGPAPESRARRAINKVKSFFTGIISSLTRATNAVTAFAMKYITLAKEAINAFCGKVRGKFSKGEQASETPAEQSTD